MSQHSVSQKRGLICTLLNKINSKLITKKKDKTIEMKKLMEALRHNNYPDWFLKQTINCMNISRTKTRVTSNHQEKKFTVILPYISGLSEKITRILKSFDVQVCTKPLKTIKDILPSTKDRIESTRRQGAIYQIPCQDCSALYIGEIGRNFKTRCAEHKRNFYSRNLAKIDDNNINKKTAHVKHVKSTIKSTGLAHQFLLINLTFINAVCILYKKTNSSINDKEDVYYNAIYNELK